MGFLNLARDMLSEHGKAGLLKLRQTGKIVAPGLTRRATKAVHKNRRLINAIGNTLGSAVNVADAASVGDLAGGLHAGVHLGQDASTLFRASKRSVTRKRARGGGVPQTSVKRVKENNSTMDNFDSNVANDPKISADLLARMQKSVRTQ